MTRPRTALALTLAAQGLTSTEIAAELGATPEAVRQALRRAGVRRPAGRPPGSATDGPVSHHSRRGRALLATLGTYAGEAGIEPEAWLEAARVEVMARRKSNRTDRRKDRTP